jgi:sialic acid synthase SpsE
MSGPYHAASLDPPQFAEMVRAIRAVEAALGTGEKVPTPGEMELAAVARKSLHWSRALARGSVVTADDLVALRPGTGLPPARGHEVIGRRVVVATEPGRMVRLDDVRGRGSS